MPQSGCSSPTMNAQTVRDQLCGGDEATAYSDLGCQQIIRTHTQTRHGVICKVLVYKDWFRWQYILIAPVNQQVTIGTLPNINACTGTQRFSQADNRAARVLCTPSRSLHLCITLHSAETQQGAVESVPPEVPQSP